MFGERNRDTRVRNKYIFINRKLDYTKKETDKQ